VPREQLEQPPLHHLGRVGRRLGHVLVVDQLVEQQLQVGDGVADEVADGAAHDDGDGDGVALQAGEDGVEGDVGAREPGGDEEDDADWGVGGFGGGWGWGWGWCGVVWCG